ncbi:MAG: hypothetical protein IT410_01965 [Candidatus Doudnabacteria bacterium]|nr:hypothetical protein [Candidatus Doudnabacteria bacterium]
MVKKSEKIFFAIALAIALPIVAVVLFDPVAVFYYDHEPMLRSIGSFIGTAVMIGIILVVSVVFIYTIYLVGISSRRVESAADNMTTPHRNGGFSGR